MYDFLYLGYCGYFFFFQAEDGIRDIGVTGVQTCALPISPTCRCGAPPPRSTPATCGPPGHPSSAAPPKSSTSNSTSDSPPRTPVQNGNGSNCSLQKFPVPTRTHSCGLGL